MPSNVRVMLGCGVLAGALTTILALAPKSDDGQEIFRNDTFGDEKFWTDTARMQEVVQSSVSPNLALKVGLKNNADGTPPAVAQAIKAGQVDLNSPATT